MANLKVPPQNEEAETSVLGAILIDKNAINIVSGILLKEDFYNSINGDIFDAMLELSEERKPIDLVTLRSLLRKKKMYDKIGASYLTDLVNSVPTSAHVEQYALLIKDAAIKRSLIEIGSNIVEMGFSHDDTKQILDKSESGIFSISKKNTVRGFLPIKEALAESFDRIDELHKKGVGLRGIK